MLKLRFEQLQRNILWISQELVPPAVIRRGLNKGDVVTVRRQKPKRTESDWWTKDAAYFEFRGEVITYGVENGLARLVVRSLATNLIVELPYIEYSGSWVVASVLRRGSGRSDA